VTRDADELSALAFLLVRAEVEPLIFYFWHYRGVEDKRERKL
jgi:hypothetical protein